MKVKNLYVIFLGFVIPVTVLTMAMDIKGKKSISPGPKSTCDIYAAGGTPCVAAHSTTRALYAAYNGPLYQVMRESDGKRLDIGLVQPKPGDAGGYANAAAQDKFCANTVCLITKIYDQTGKGNHLTQGPPGTFKGPAKGGFDNLPIADMAPVSIGGHKVYGVYIMPGMGLRNNDARDIAINDEPEGIYYVVNGKHYDSGCCFDYGNSSTNSRAVGTGTMETTYYGTSTAWGSGNGAGPWIMADMEAGLFSGYNAKKNDVPAIDSWHFVTAMVGGGGGNKWDLRGGDAQKGGLTTFYSGVRPGTPASNAYSPMNKKGGMLLGNGGDNGNGSSGTFYEGVMTTGHPDAATADAVQANIVAAKYNEQPINLSRITTFTPKVTKEVTLTFNNTTGLPVRGVKLSLSSGRGWTIRAQGSANASKVFTGTVAPDASVSATFKVISPATPDAAFLTGIVNWTNPNTTGTRSEIITQRIRNVLPVKINEVRFGTGKNPTNQFIELYNAGDVKVDISNWSLINTRSEWAPVRLGVIPAGTKLAAHGYYVLALSPSGLIAPAEAGQQIINVQSTAGFEVGQQINIDGEMHKIANIGTPATAMTTLFVPVSTSSRLTFPAGSTNLPVTNAAGFAVGQKIGIDLGGNYEVAMVTAVGKAATQANLYTAAKAGNTSIKVTDNANMVAGDILTINTGSRKETATVKRVVNTVTAPARGTGEAGEVELTAPLKFDHMTGVDVFEAGTGISFLPATRFAHQSGDAVQALGSVITLANKLSANHKVGAPIVNTQVTTAGYQDARKPDQWFGYPLSSTEGSIALMDAGGKILVDGLVYGPAQSNSSANGTITSPEIATLEGDQSQGGCIVIMPAPGRGGAATDQSNRSVGRYPDGYDSDSNCSDFMAQSTSTLAAAAAVGSNNIKISSVSGFTIGQKINIDIAANSEAAVIAAIGTTGATTVNKAAEAGVTTVPLTSAVGFSAGQTITIGSGTSIETAVIASVTAVRRRPGNAGNGPGDSIDLTQPLKYTHAAADQVSGSGITLTQPLTKAHDSGVQIVSGLPTPGKANQYSR